MTIATYSELQSAVANWIARSDLTSVIPDFIAIFEAVANRRLRVRKMETTASLSTTNGTTTLPTDYMAWRRVYYTSNGASAELEYVHPSYLNALYPSGAPGWPKAFTISGDNFRALPYDDTASAFTIDYYQKIPALSSASTNWLLTAYPDVYLQGTLVEAYQYTKAYDQALTCSQRRDALFDEIITLDAMTRGPSAMRVMGPCP